ncbi:hypothetical protein CIB48_g11735 [Xylaria polymorpha]|nr:hypothetical protein CIB48_g11735 [Xylaria polymorpha]
MHVSPLLADLAPPRRDVAGRLGRARERRRRRPATISAHGAPSYRTRNSTKPELWPGWRICLPALQRRDNESRVRLLATVYYFHPPILHYVPLHSRLPPQQAQTTPAAKIKIKNNPKQPLHSPHNIEPHRNNPKRRSPRPQGLSSIDPRRKLRQPTADMGTRSRSSQSPSLNATKHTTNPRRSRRSPVSNRCSSKHRRGGEDDNGTGGGHIRARKDCALLGPRRRGKEAARREALRGWVRNLGDDDFVL